MRPAEAQVRRQVLILDEVETFFFSKGSQDSQTPQPWQEPVPAVTVQQPHLPERKPYLIAHTIVYDGRPAAGRQQACLNGEKNIRIGAATILVFLHQHC